MLISFRWPIDWFEEYTTSLADLVVVNSRYTEQVFRRTFPRLKNTPVEVLYPTVCFSLYDAPLRGDLSDIPLMKTSRTTFLSLNRFERKKDIGLAIRALGMSLFYRMLFFLLFKYRAIHCSYTFIR